MANNWGWPFRKSYTGMYEEGQQFGNTAHPRGRGFFHDGFDFGSAIYGSGSEILAVHEGEIIYTGYMGTELGSVIILSVPPYQVMYQEFSFSTSDIHVATGNRVSKGQVIGRLTSSHLHLGITQKDWRTALNSWDINDGTWLNPISIIQSSTGGTAGITYDPKTMKTSPRGIALIKQFEGLRLAAYQDSVGVWTIGYGHTKNVYPGMVITEAQATAFLTEDVAVHASGIGKYVKVKLNQNQFDALASFHFNLGADILNGSALLSYINAQQWQAAAAEMKKYVYAGNQVLQGLVARRNAEADLFLSNEDSTSDFGEGEIEMKCLYQIDGKNAVFYFDGFEVRPLTHPDEMKVLQDIYKANNGKDMPFFNWTSNVPWYYRLKDILQRPKEF